jgi:glutathione S-transferase
MIKLYHAPGACSFAAHMALEESGVAYEVARVNLAEGEQRTPAYLAINPKGRVPALADGDFVVTEVPAILRYVSRLAAGPALWPANARDDARCAEWLAWISSGVHVAYAHIRRAERYADSDAGKAEVIAKGKITAREIWEQVEQRVGSQTWIAGDSFSVADMYLTVFWTWGRGPALGYDMPADFPQWTAHARRVAERPAVRRVFERDGIVLP